MVKCAARQPLPPSALFALAKTKPIRHQAAMTIIDTRTPDPKRLIPGATGDWEVIIGMEVHAQVTSEAKLFSGASTAFGAAPNANVSLVDAAMPGMLPVINEECVQPGDPHRPRAEGADQPQVGLRPEELFLSRPAAGLPDLAVQAADRRRGHGHRFGRPRSRRASSRTSRSASSGCIWSRTPASRCTTSIRPCPMSISTAPAWR